MHYCMCVCILICKTCEEIKGLDYLITEIICCICILFSEPHERKDLKHYLKKFDQFDFFNFKSSFTIGLSNPVFKMMGRALLKLDDLLVGIGLLFSLLLFLESA